MKKVIFFIFDLLIGCLFILSLPFVVLANIGHGMAEECYKSLKNKLVTKSTKE